MLTSSSGFLDLLGLCLPHVAIHYATQDLPAQMPAWTVHYRGLRAVASDSARAVTAKRAESGQ